MKYKALMLDIDGTIIPYRKDALPSLRVKEAIRKAHEKVKVCLATGRPYFMVKHLIEYLDLHGLVIMNDGAQVMDSKTKKIYYERQLDISDAKKACDILHNAGVEFLIHDSGKDFVYSKRYSPQKPFNIFSLKSYEESFADTVIDALSDIPTIKVNKTHFGKKNQVGFLISHAEATKLHGIFEVAKIWNITTEEIIGVGDSGNDFQLLMASGLKVAMGNALPELKDIADYIAPSVTEDGVADVIEKFILNEVD
jgi:HAD superfamily hydrolase (TIGR01484 family)